MKKATKRWVITTVAAVLVGCSGVYVLSERENQRTEQVRSAFKAIEKERYYKFVKVHPLAKDTHAYKDAQKILNVKYEGTMDDPKDLFRQFKEAEDYYETTYAVYDLGVRDGTISGYTFETWSKERFIEDGGLTVKEADAITPNRRRLDLMNIIASDIKARTGETPPAVTSALNAAINIYAAPKLEYSFEQEKFDRENQMAVDHFYVAAKKAYKQF